MIPWKFLLKLTVFLALLAGAQLYVGSWFTVSFPKKDQLDEAFADDTPILYFSDSINFSTHPDDAEKCTIAQHLQALLEKRDRDHTVTAIDHGGYQLDVYVRYIEYMVRKQRKPELLIIPLNPRSFYPAWDLEPMYQFDDEKTILTFDRPGWRSFCKPFLVFKGQSLTECTRDNSLNRLNYAIQQSNVPKDFFYTTTSLAPYFNGFLTPEHRKIKSLRRICELCRRNHYSVLFYIVAADYDLTQNTTLSHTYAYNVAFLQTFLSENGFECLTLTRSLPSSCFMDSEHLREAGRRQIAALLLPNVQACLQDKSSRWTPLTVRPTDPAPRHLVPLVSDLSSLPISAENWTCCQPDAVCRDEVNGARLTTTHHQYGWSFVYQPLEVDDEDTYRVEVTCETEPGSAVTVEALRVGDQVPLVRAGLPTPVLSKDGPSVLRYTLKVRGEPGHPFYILIANSNSKVDVPSRLLVKDVSISKLP